MAASQITRRALAASLKELTRERLFDKISVGDITANCGINRQTFYYHFSDKYELLDWIYYEEAFVPLTQGITLENWPERLCELLLKMREDSAFYMHTIRCSDDLFGNYLYKALVELHERAIHELETGLPITDEEAHLYASFFAHGLTDTIIDWAIEGMRADAHLLSERIGNLVIYSESIFKERRGVREKEK